MSNTSQSSATRQQRSPNPSPEPQPPLLYSTGVKLKKFDLELFWRFAPEIRNTIYEWYLFKEFSGTRLLRFRRSISTETQYTGREDLTAAGLDRTVQLVPPPLTQIRIPQIRDECNSVLFGSPTFKFLQVISCRDTVHAGESLTALVRTINNLIYLKHLPLMVKNVNTFHLRFTKINTFGIAMLEPIIKAMAALYSHRMQAKGIKLQFCDINQWEFARQNIFIQAMALFVGRISCPLGRTAERCSCTEIDRTWADGELSGEPHHLFQCYTHVRTEIKRLMFCRRQEREFFMDKNTRNAIRGFIPYQFIGDENKKFECPDDCCKDSEVYKRKKVLKL